ncbi:hypothetical protein [Azospirillum sp. B2RO_4]|uniref:hypothetical protein n=1 Tax=Azospirillum sp. B2RO_4 TaxID=3027796 RepID=UPI003DA7BCFA
MSLRFWRNSFIAIISFVAILISILVSQWPSITRYRDIERGISACSVGLSSEATVSLGVKQLKREAITTGDVNTTTIPSILQGLKNDDSKIVAFKVIQDCVKNYTAANISDQYVVQRKIKEGDEQISHYDGGNGDPVTNCVSTDPDGWDIVENSGRVRTYAAVNATFVFVQQVKNDKYNWCQTWYAGKGSGNRATNMAGVAQVFLERKVLSQPKGLLPSIWEYFVGSV